MILYSTFHWKSSQKAPPSPPLPSYTKACYEKYHGYVKSNFLGFFTTLSIDRMLINCSLVYTTLLWICNWICKEVLIVFQLHVLYFETHNLTCEYNGSILSHYPLNIPLLCGVIWSDRLKTVGDMICQKWEFGKAIRFLFADPVMKKAVIQNSTTNPFLYHNAIIINATLIFVEIWPI